ncbi:MAG: acylphosphatase [Halobacteriota archaeon]
MTKARFYIKGKVQDVGYRPYVMKEIIKREGLNGIADNYKYSQALTFEQLGKGIPILKGIYRSIEGTNENIRGMSTRIEGMDENIKGMNEKLDKVPERIAKELKKVLKHFLSKERTCAKKG